MSEDCTTEPNYHKKMDVIYAKLLIVKIVFIKYERPSILRR